MEKKKQDEGRNSLINQKIRGAAFVLPSNEKKERFKYNKSYNIYKRASKLKLRIKRKLNSITQGIKLKLDIFDWKQARTSSIIWIAEAIIEGLLINFATHQLFGFKITVWTILSYGILVKQTIDIYRRLKDGTTSKLIKKDE